MRSIVLVIVCVGFMVSVAAQTVATDSVYIFSQSKKDMRQVLHNATNLVSSPVEKAGTAWLQWQHTNGSWRLPYQAQTQSMASLYTEGFSTIGRFKIAGKFLFDKAWEDSLGWNLQGIYDPAQPYYLFAGKAGSYERQNYNMQAIVSYALLQEKLFLSSGIDYRHHWTTRSVDPRPDTRSLDVKVSPGLTYKWQHHHIGASLLWGRGNEKTDISYKNDNFGQSTLYTDRVVYMSLGFGYYGRMGNYLRRYQTFQGAGVHYAGKINDWSIKANYQYQLQEQDIGRQQNDTRKNHIRYAFVQTESSDASLLLQKAGKRSSHQVQAVFATQSTLNWASEFQASSYQYLTSRLGLGYNFHFAKHKTWQGEIEAGATYQSFLKEDAVAAHRLQVQYVQPWMQAKVYRRVKDDLFAAAIRPSYRKALTHNLLVPPTQVTYFTQGLVYPEFQYYSTGVLEAGLQLNYSTRSLISKVATGLFLHATLQLPAAAVPVVEESIVSPLGKRMMVAVGIQLYL